MLNQVDGAWHGASSMISSKLETMATQGKAPFCLANENVLKEALYHYKTEREMDREEHQRFLEALKLYDRAWRQIEEYVGSKTAIQIRSHAQKFFVARDSGNDGDESLSAIDIPPPRPKKKPLHPYPRKMADSPVYNKAVSGQPERCPSPNVFGRESCSPDSVLSAIVQVGNSCNGVKLAVEAPLASIKLFRQTVFTPDTNNLAPRAPYSCNSLPSEATEKEIKISNEDVLPGFQANQINSQFIFAMVPGNMIPPVSWLSQNMPETNPESTVAFPTTISWWSWYQDLAYRSVLSGGQKAMETAAHCEGGSKDEEPQREGSLTGSSCGSASESKCTTKSDKWNNSKGFVPYKRCLVKRDDKLSGAVLEDTESQRIRVCS
ncbi:unnamed protein product [Withania somnifera]